MTSTAVAVALVILFCITINVHLSKTKCVRTHTERHDQDGFVYFEEALDSASNHGEGVAL